MARRFEMAAGARVGLGGMLLATFVALRTRAASSRARAALTEAGRAEAERGRDRLQGQLERSQVELRRRRELVERLTRARRAEREFNVDLREQLEHAHRTGGSPGDPDEDVRE